MLDLVIVLKIKEAVVLRLKKICSERNYTLYKISTDVYKRQVHRYDILRTLGVDADMIDKAIFRQVFIYFFLPLGLAMVHYAVGMRVVNDVLAIFGSVNSLKNIVFGLMFILALYGGYFVVTYLGYKNVVRTRNR